MTVHFTPDGLALEHTAATVAFGFLTAEPPAHELIVSVVDKQTGAPISDVEVRCDRYAAITGASGRAQIDLPSGVYSVSGWKTGYEEAPATIVEVTSHLWIRVEMELAAPKDVDEQTVWM